MIVREFQKEDQETLKEWLILRKMDPRLANEVPEIGLMAIEGESAIAAGFLRQIEASDSILMDGLISNPKRQGRLSSRALDLIVSGLSERASFMGYRNIIANTKNLNVIKRSEWHGFLKLPHWTIVKGLGENVCHL